MGKRKNKKVVQKKQVVSEKKYFWSKYGVMAHSESEAKRLATMKRNKNTQKE